MADNMAGANSVAAKLAGGNPDSFAKVWAEGAGAPDAEKVAGQVSWLAKRLGSDAQELLGLFLAGAGTGKVGILTLSQIALDMRAAGVENADAATLERFMKYKGGVPGDKREASGTEHKFSVEVALKCAHAIQSNAGKPVSAKPRSIANKQVSTMYDTIPQDVAPPIANVPKSAPGKRKQAAPATIATAVAPAMQKKAASLYAVADSSPQQPALPSETTNFASETTAMARASGAKNAAVAGARMNENDFTGIIRKDLQPIITKKYTDGVSKARPQPLNDYGGSVIFNDSRNYSRRQEYLAAHLSKYGSNPIAKKFLANMGEWVSIKSDLNEPHGYLNDPRPNGEGVSMIVFHTSGTDAEESSYNTFKSYSKDYSVTGKDGSRVAKKGGRAEEKAEVGLNVGAHYIIHKDGKIDELAPVSQIVMGALGYNLVSINVEIVATDGGSVTLEQKEAGARLSAYLMEKYPRINYVAGHFELYDKGKPYVDLFIPNGDLTIAKLRDIGKSDPGESVIGSIRSQITKINPALALITTKKDAHVALLASR